MYEPNIRAPNYSKQILTYLKGEIDNTVIIGTSISHFQQWTDHPERKSTRKVDLNYFPNGTDNLQNMPSNSSRKHTPHHAGQVSPSS